MNATSPRGGGAGLAFLNLAHFYSHLFLMIYPVAVLDIEKEMGGSYGELLALSIPGYVLFGVAALPAGWLGDRWSARRMMALYFLGTGAGSVVTGLATGPAGLAIGIALIGLFASIYHPVGTAQVVAQAKNRGRALGLNGVFGSAGFATAPALTGLLIWAGGWRASFIVPGIVCMVSGVGYLAARRVAGRGAAPMDSSVGPPAAAETGRSVALRGLLILAVTSLSVGLISQCVIVGLPKVFDVRVSLLASVGLLGTSGLVTAALMFSMAGQLIGGRMADRYPLKLVYFTCYALVLPLALIASGAFELPLVVVCALVMMLTSAGLPAENSLIARFCPADWHARAYGTKFVLALGVSALAVPMVGLIYDRTREFTWLFVVVAGLAAVVAGGAFLLPGARAGAVPAAAE